MITKARSWKTLALTLLCVASAVAQPSANVTVAEQKQVLSPILCGICFEAPKDGLRQLTAIGEMRRKSKSFEISSSRDHPRDEPVSMEMLDGYSRQTEAEKAGAVLIVPDGRVPKSGHVCVGKQYAVRPDSFRRYRRIHENWDLMEPIGVAADGVCIGRLVEMTAFFSQVVQHGLVDALTKFEARTGDAQLTKIIRDALPQVLGELKEQIVLEAKAAILRELRSQPISTTPDEGKPQVCTAMATCGGKAPKDCCKCYDAPYGGREGTCQGNVFTPKAQDPR